MSRALRMPVYVHEGIAHERALRRKTQVHSYALRPTGGRGRPDATETLSVGPFMVEALAIPHDAPQVALRVASGNRSFAIATDLRAARPGRLVALFARM